MCGRFYDIHDLDDITSRFRVDRPRDLSLPFRYNVAPTQIVPVIRVEDDKRELVLMRWGLIPHWEKDERIGYKMINARAETVREKPSYRDAYASRRLIVPVSGFYEWKREGAHKQPFAIRHPDQSPLAFAGLWGAWHDLDTFTIVTTEANATHAAPSTTACPSSSRRSSLTNGSTRITPTPSNVLTSVPQEELELVPVSDWVNNARHDDPRCLEPR